MCEFDWMLSVLILLCIGVGSLIYLVGVEVGKSITDCYDREEP